MPDVPEGGIPAFLNRLPRPREWESDASVIEILPTRVAAVSVLMLLTSTTGALADDAIDETLARDLGRIVDAIPQRDDSPARDRAYLCFLQVVYGTNPLALAQAQGLYRQLDLPESEAFLGSLDILEARDLSRSGPLAGLIHLWAERRLVLQGIGRLDAAVSAHPANVDVRVVRAVTYLQLPSLFGKFRTGLEDIETILTWIQTNKATIPKEDRLYRDQSSLYYYAGQYFQKAGRADQARHLFIQSSQASPRSPFAQAAHRRVRDPRLRS
jgi:hypothetical protein